MKNKGSGWKNESRRHSLARKGIKTVLPDGRRFDVSKFVASGEISNQALYNLITSGYNKIWDELNISSGSEIRNDPELQRELVIRMDKLLPKGTKLPAELFFWFEDRNYHTLNDYLLRENKFESDKTLIGYRDNYIKYGLDSSLSDFYDKHRKNWYYDNQSNDESGSLKASGWHDKLHDVYSNFDEWKAYSEIYGLHHRLGFDTPEQAWEENPHIKGGVDPADFGHYKGGK